MEKLTLTQVKGSYNYKLIIPKKVEDKIRYTCKQVWNTEWSGVLFFKYEGSFDNDDLTIICEDICIMDIGSTTYTEFDMNPYVISYMTDNDLLDCQVGLIHSHNNMATFFSGTDLETLRVEGTDRNNFVSLIVNNAGTYTAAITRKVKSRSIKEELSYEFFGSGEVQSTEEYVDESVKIEYFNLKIEKEGEVLEFLDIKDKLEEIKRKKEEDSKKSKVVPYQLSYTGSSYSIPAFSKEGKKEPTKSIPKQQSLFETQEFPEDNMQIPYGKNVFDKKMLEQIITQLITCNVLILDTNKVDLNRWVASMPNIYEKRFGKGKEGLTNFKSWAGSFVEYLMWTIPSEELEKEGLVDVEISALLANDLIVALNKFPANKYLDIYIETLNDYVI